MQHHHSLPPPLQAVLAGAWRQPERIGASGATVEQVGWPDGRLAYLKYVLRPHPQRDAELLHETEVLRWLHGQLPVPPILAAGSDSVQRYLLTQAIMGMMAHEVAQHPSEVAQALGRGLCQIHALPITDCAFEQGLDTKLMQAHAHVAQHLVDSDDFQSEHQEQSPEELLAQLLAERPPHENRVFTHGDYCLPNVLLDPASLQVTGFVDWGRAGIADRYQDLGIAARSIRRNLGPHCVAPFFAAYGERSPDRAKIAYYIMLDELF